MVKVLNAFNTETNSISIDSDQLIQTVDKSIDLGATTNVYSTVSSLPTLAQAYSKALVTDTNTCMFVVNIVMMSPGWTKYDAKSPLSSSSFVPSDKKRC